MPYILYQKVENKDKTETIQLLKEKRVGVSTVSFI